MPAKKAPAKKAAKKAPAKKAAKQVPAKPIADQKLEALVRMAIGKMPEDKELASQYELGAADAWLDVILLIKPAEGEVNRIAREIAAERKKEKKK